MTNNARLRLGYAYDKQSEQQVSAGVRNIQKRLDKLNNIQDSLTKRLNDGTISLKAYQKGLKLTDAEAKQLQKTLDRLSDTPPPRALDVQNDRFDSVSRDVGLAGDVQSNLGAIQGIGSAAGVDTGAVGLVGEVVVLAEELPRLKTSLAGLPNTVNAAAKALNTTPAALGALGAGVLALVAVLAIAQQQAQASRETIQATFNALERENEIRQETSVLTSKEIQTKLEEARAKQELAQQNRDQAQAIEDQLNAQENGIRIIGEVSGALGVGNQAFSETDKRLRETNGTLNEANQEVALYEAALNSSTTAVNDAVAAEEARGEALIAEAQTAGQTVAMQERARNATVAANESRLQAIDSETAALQAEIAVLESSGNTSEEVADRLAELNGELNQLGQESEFIKGTALDLARAREQEATAQKAQEKAQQDAQRKAQQAASEIERAEDQIASARRKASDATRQAKVKLERTNEDINRDLDRTFTDIASGVRKGIKETQFEIAEAQFEAQLSAAQDEQRGLRQHLDALADIREDALNSEEDLVRGRDFLGLRDLTRDTERRKRQQDVSLSREERERDIQSREELDEIERQGDLKLDAVIDQGKEERREAQLAARRKQEDTRINAKRAIIDARAAARAEISLAQQTIQQKLQLEQQYAQQSLAITQGLVQGAASAGGAADPNALTRPQSNIAGKTVSGVFSSRDLGRMLQQRRSGRTLPDELNALGF
ncbi:MAG: hypothetical protein ACPG7F_01180 [Aggregatilineales bacterium]